MNILKSMLDYLKGLYGIISYYFTKNNDDIIGRHLIDGTGVWMKNDELIIVTLLTNGKYVHEKNTGEFKVYENVVGIATLIYGAEYIGDL